MAAIQIHSQQNTRAHHLHLQKAAADFEAITYPRGSSSRRFKDRGPLVRPLAAIELSFAAATCLSAGRHGCLAFTRAYSLFYYVVTACKHRSKR